MKKLLQLIKELKKTPRGRGILFFAFYFVFFLLIAIVARTFPTNREIKKEEDVFNISNINGNNYAYIYNINVDSNITNITGKRIGNEEEFTYEFNNTKSNYYKNGLSYYTNGLSVDIPCEYLYIIDNLDSLIENAYYVSTTNYQSKRKVYRYEISSSTITRLVNNLDIDIEEIPNEIILTQNEDKIDEVELNLNSYCLAINKCINNMNIHINYNDFGNVQVINNK